MERADLCALCYETFRSASLLAGSLDVQMDKRVQFRLQLLNAFEMEFNDFDGRDFSGADSFCDFRRSGVEEEAHDLMRESKRADREGQATRREQRA